MLASEINNIILDDNINNTDVIHLYLLILINNDIY